jgi:ribonuclease HI
MTQWVKNWKKNKWIKSNKQPVENQQDIAKLDDLCSKIKVNWVNILKNYTFSS